ncbi:hypothetical protein HJC22_31445 [Corallococcus exiguus]|uniref:Uncharacterized protein n=1 Tax=Corallococcus exiguus TaxID=83462 RepID=A0A7X5BSF8_9BACT|nr:MULTISPECIES: hypothetical protein [Corallococcus]NBC41849.1 hypothetical protein [Corallococcus exiguus]NNC20245.1 hypothetical protein [Corallococcus exiguus]NRD57377.1 hypothetical protein [Corallococcus exiguus]RKH17885.1 hypothetical protein D7V77_35040 [Corallococcus sp. CA041A]TNV58521.1 hypothetical protein FH620_27675 [Corallococcus exiguus]
MVGTGRGAYAKGEHAPAGVRQRLLEEFARRFGPWAACPRMEPAGQFDMWLGDIELSKTCYHNDLNGQIPLLGSLARDSRDVEVGKHLRVLK